MIGLRAYATCCRAKASAATQPAKARRAARPRGVVFGSEIMKKVKSSTLPDSSWCSSTGARCPRYRTRAARSRIHEPRKARLTSLRKARCATMQPSPSTQRSRSGPSPHCAGEHQACGVRSMQAQRPKLAGLTKWRPRMRRTNLLAMARNAASGGSQMRSVRSSSVRPKEVMTGESRPASGRRSNRVKATCVPSAVAKMSGACQSGKSRAERPTVRKEARKGICSHRGSRGRRRSSRRMQGGTRVRPGRSSGARNRGVCAGLRDQHGGAADLASAQRPERPVRLFERETLHLDAQLALAGDEEELLSVPPGEVRDGAQGALAPEQLVREAGDVAHVDASGDDRSAFGGCSQRRRDERADWREDERGVQLLGRLLVRAARPDRAELAREALAFRVAGAREGEDAAALVHGDLGDQVGG